MITDKCDSLMVCRDQPIQPFLVLQIGLSVTSAGDERLPALAVTMPVATLLPV